MDGIPGFGAIIEQAGRVMRVMESLAAPEAVTVRDRGSSAVPALGAADADVSNALGVEVSQGEPLSP